MKSYEIVVRLSEENNKNNSTVIDGMKKDVFLNKIYCELVKIKRKGVFVCETLVKCIVRGSLGLSV